MLKKASPGRGPETYNFTFSDHVPDGEVANSMVAFIHFDGPVDENLVRKLLFLFDNKYSKITFLLLIRI